MRWGFEDKGKEVVMVSFSSLESEFKSSVRSGKKSVLQNCALKLWFYPVKAELEVQA